MALVVKYLPASAEDVRDAVQSLGQEDPLEEGMATHSSIFAWRIPWAEETVRLPVHGVSKSRTQQKRLSTHAHTLGGCTDKIL